MTTLSHPAADPPVSGCSLGSLCFMTPFAVSELKQTLDLAVEARARRRIG